MSTVLYQRLDEWATWWIENQDRLPLYYQQRGVLETRDRFLVTCLDGFYELLARIVEQMQEQHWLRYDRPMASTVARQIQRDYMWFSQHKDTIMDHDKRFDFLMRAYAKGLQGLKAVAEELDVIAGRETPKPEKVVLQEQDDAA